MTREDRLVGLYSALGLNVQPETINRAEIMAYCAGLGMLDDMIKVTIDENTISKTFSLNYDEFYDYLGDDPLYFHIGSSFVNVYEANLAKIGLLVRDWFSPFCKVIMNGDGVPWDKMNLTWNAIDKMSYRWSMINNALYVKGE